MKYAKKFIIGLAAVLMVFTLACNLLKAFSPATEEPVSAPPIEEKDEIVEEPTPTFTAEPLPTDTPEPESDTAPELWITASTEGGVRYKKESDTEWEYAHFGGFVRDTSAAPVGGRVAIIHSEDWSGISGHLWLKLLELATGEITTVTRLTNEDTVIPEWDSEYNDFNREANIAVTYASPIWTPDGKTLVFIGAQEGTFARPYAYHLETAELHDLSLGGESHYYNPKLSPDGEFIIVPSAYQFGTGAGYSMDSFYAASVSGGEAWSLFEIHGIDMRVWGWLDSRTVVISSVDIMAGARNLRTIDIFSSEEQTIVKDYISDVAVATDQRSVMFTSMMGEFLDFAEPEMISESGLYHWDSVGQQLTKVNDYAENSSRVEWNIRSECYFADLPKFNNQREDEIWVYDAFGQIGSTCQPINPLAQDIPQVSATGDYYAWANLVFGDADQNAFYVQAYNGAPELVVQDDSVYGFAWHLYDDVLLFKPSNGALAKAEGPDFVWEPILELNEGIQMACWVEP